MPSPVGHILAGAAVYLAATNRHNRSEIALGLTLLGSILPDFDFLPGIVMGKMGAFHHGISHSLAFAVLFGGFWFLFARRIEKADAVQLSVLAALAYATHVVLDFVSVSEGSRGVPIFWPLSDERVGYNLHFFGHFRWSDIRDGLRSIVRWDNVVPVLREILVLGSLVLLLLWRERCPSHKRG